MGKKWMIGVLLLSSALLLAACGGGGGDGGGTPTVTSGELTGRVMDDSGLPVVGAAVTLEGPNRFATSGPDGTYRIQNVPAGTYTITVVFSGLTFSRVIVQVFSGQVTEMNLIGTIGSAPPQVQQVVVTPPQLQFTGGTVNVTAAVVDVDSDPIVVTGSFATPGGPSGTFELIQGTDNTWTGTAALPANPSGSTRTYTITVTARDRVNTVTGSATATVAGVLNPNETSGGGISPPVVPDLPV
jgi:hypothetical protein